MNVRQYALPALLAGAALLPVAATAGTITGNLPVQIIITGDCTFVAGNMDFGTHTNTLSNIDVAGSVTVNCTNTLPYTISLNQGGGSGATVALRQATSGSNTLDYELYTDANRTTLWGDGSLGTIAQGGVGTGSAQPIDVYGRVIAQSTPPSGTYTDSVTATITW